MWAWNVSLCYSAACPTSGSRPCSPVTQSGSHPDCILNVDHDHRHSCLVTLGPTFLWFCKYIGAIDKPFAINRCVISHLTITLTLMHMVLKLYNPQTYSSSYFMKWVILRLPDGTAALYPAEAACVLRFLEPKADLLLKGCQLDEPRTPEHCCNT